MIPKKFNLNEISEELTEAWSPKDIETVNDFVLRVGKFDGEYHWGELNTYLGTYPTNINTLVLIPTRPTVLYAGTSLAGVFRTEGWPGDRWAAINRGLTSFNVWAIVFDPTNPSLGHDFLGSACRWWRQHSPDLER